MFILADLGEEVAKKLPKDYYSGKPLIYQRKDKGQGYLLYSVGPNLKDDAGTSALDATKQGEHISDDAAIDLDSETADDRVIRLPLPKVNLARAFADAAAEVAAK